MNPAGHQTRTADASDRASLDKGIVRSHQIPHGGTIRVEIIEGSAWITMEGDHEDYVVATGETMTCFGPGLLVMEGLSDRTLLEMRI